MVRPYQERVDEFLADYQDKFLPTLITGKGTKESPYTNMSGPETAMPMTKEQGQLERDKLLASSIHPDTFNKILDIFGPKSAYAEERPIPISGQGTKENPYTNLSGPSYSAFDPFRQRNEMEEAAAMREKAGITYNPNRGPLTQPGGLGGFLKERGWTGTMPGTVSAFTPPPEERITGLGTKENPYTNLSGPDLTTKGGLTWDQINNAILRQSGIQTGITGMKGTPFEGMEFTQEQADALFNKPIPVGGGPGKNTLESLWGIKREGNVFTLPGGEGTMTVGPERFFLGGKEVPAGTPGAMSGDQLARERIGAESDAQRTAWGEEFAPVPRSYYEAHPEERYLDELSRRNKPIMDNILRAIEQNRQMLQGYGLSSDRNVAEIQRLGAGKRLQGLSEVLVTAGAIPGQTTAKFLENIGQGSQRQAMADYYNRMAGVHEAAIPSETFARYATGAHALSEAERPYAFPPNSAVYQGAKLLGYVPEKPEAIHPIILDIINKSELIDPNTGMKTGGFDIRGARQKIGYIAPWLGSRGIDVPKEAYKMTKPEFLGEQKSFIAKLPKKERNRYTKDYTEQLWKEYWGE